ncbi:hypothetical protein CDAR_93281 [Caerostris darwini]|uniref:Uncharacterized protein n=1 Tax=Caerostris darwini TaxID=1538125 RepID=A0AAV4UW49_9ARAC|nr:hypothetical protein CDAR_93281 [Caerostris darwini]
MTVGEGGKVNADAVSGLPELGKQFYGEIKRLFSGQFAGYLKFQLLTLPTYGCSEDGKIELNFAGDCFSVAKVLVVPLCEKLKRFSILRAFESLTPNKEEKAILKTLLCTDFSSKQQKTNITRIVLIGKEDLPTQRETQKPVRVSSENKKKSRAHQGFV